MSLNQGTCNIILTHLCDVCRDALTSRAIHRAKGIYFFGGLTVRAGEHAVLDYSIEEGRLRVDVNPDAERCSYEDVFGLIKAHLSKGIRQFLINKNGRLRRTGIGEAIDYGNRMGTLLMLHGAQLAVVISPEDHYENVAAVYAMRRGADLLATHSEEEASLWLSGDLR